MVGMERCSACCTGMVLMVWIWISHIGLAPSWKDTLYGTPLAATLAVEAALCNKAPQAMLPPGTLSSARLTYVALMEWVWISASRRAGRVPCMFRLRRQRLQLKRFSLISLRKQCRRLVPFLFGEANPNPNLKPTWLAIMASRARPDEPEVSRWRAGGGVW